GPGRRARRIPRRPFGRIPRRTWLLGVARRLLLDVDPGFGRVPRRSWFGWSPRRLRPVARRTSLGRRPWPGRRSASRGPALNTTEGAVWVFPHGPFLCGAPERSEPRTTTTARRIRWIRRAE